MSSDVTHAPAGAVLPPRGRSVRRAFGALMLFPRNGGHFPPVWAWLAAAAVLAVMCGGLALSSMLGQFVQSAVWR